MRAALRRLSQYGLMHRSRRIAAGHRVAGYDRRDEARVRGPAAGPGRYEVTSGNTAVARPSDSPASLFTIARP